MPRKIGESLFMLLSICASRAIPFHIACAYYMRFLCTWPMRIDSSLAVAVAMAPFDSRFDPRQRRHLIRAQLVSQLIRVQLWMQESLYRKRVNYTPIPYVYYNKTSSAQFPKVWMLCDDLDAIPWKFLAPGRTLGDVRHILNLKRNLILLSTLDSKWYKYIGECRVLKVNKCVLIVMKGKKRFAKLYVFRGSTITELDFEGANISMGPNGSRSKLIYLVGMGYGSQIGSRFIIVYKGILLFDHQSNQRLRRVLWNPWQSNGKLRNMKNRSFEVLCHKQIRNARSKRCPDRASGHTIGWRRKSMIRTTYPDRICYRPGKHATCPLGGIRMKLIRIAWRRGTFSHLEFRPPTFHIRNSVRRHFTSRIPSVDISHPEFRPPTFHIRNSIRRHFTAGWERRTFQLLRSDLSGSSDSAYQESFSLNIQCHGVLLKLPNISDRHLEIFCFRYLLSKSPKSPCNPSIIGFLSL
uniref:Uncharacterized protein n=1 Tax=Vitis vinifera TaxID=29760 RepID=A5AMB6_VITVI|nr:hypothetical protein VITISV_029024 [Vitis vinifera]